MTTTNIDSTDLPTANLDQLHWVRIVPKVSFARSSSSLALEDASDSISTSAIDHPLWWPCLIFNEYADFQDFFEDELAVNHDDDIVASTCKKNKNALEARKLILSRVFTIMLQRKPVMVVRLLGRPIQDYMEILPFPEEEEEEEDTSRRVQTLESHQATHYVPFTALPSQESIRQMDPEAFSVVVSNDHGNNNDDDATTIIDEKLYMNYMLALDISATQRMSGLIAPNKTLQSVFRDIGRAELDKLLSPPSIQDLPDTALAITSTPSVTNNDDDEIEEDSEEDNSDSDDGESCDKNKEDQAAVDDGTAQKGLVTVAVAVAVAVAAEAKAIETKDLQDMDDDAAAALPKESFAPEPSREALTVYGINAEPKCSPAVSTASAATNRKNDDARDSGKKPRIEEQINEEQNAHKDDDSTTDESHMFSSSATVVTLSSEGSCTSPSSHGNDSNEDDKDDDEDPKICSGDALDVVHRKLELIGWNIDLYLDLYLSPKVGFDDIKNNPHGKGTDFFLTKEGFQTFLREKYGWGEKRAATKSMITPEKLGLSRKPKRATVTPTSPDRPRRNRRRTGSNGGDDVESPKRKKKKIVFKTEEEEYFYEFKPLISKLKHRLGWKYVLGTGLHSFIYVQPGCKSEGQGGTYLNDFFCEESEVIKYCMSMDYYANRQELGLV